MTHRIPLLALRTSAALLLAFTLTRCALFGPSESFERASDYKVAVPDGWTTTKRGEADRAFRTVGKGVATLTSSCTRPTDATLDQLTRHLLFGLRKMNVVEKASITVGGETGLRTRVDAAFEGKPVHLEVVVVRRGICVIDFSLMNQGGLSAGDRQAFQSFVSSFQFGKGGT